MVVSVGYEVAVVVAAVVVVPEPVAVVAAAAGHIIHPTTDILIRILLPHTHTQKKKRPGTQVAWLFTSKMSHHRSDPRLGNACSTYDLAVLMFPPCPALCDLTLTKDRQQPLLYSIQHILL